MSKRPRHAYVAPSWAREQRLGHVGLKATLMVLADYADENASCYPSQETIADETEQDTRTIRRHLEIFREVGLIRSQRRDRNGRRTSDRHWLQLDRHVTVEDIEAAKATIKARRAPAASTEGPTELPDTVTGSQEDTVTGGLPDTRGGSYRTPEGGPTGHPLSGEGSTPYGSTTPGTPSEELASTHAGARPVPTEPGPDSDLATRLASSEQITSLRAALRAAHLDITSWVGLTTIELAEIVDLVATRGTHAMLARAKHQAGGRGEPPIHVRAWLPEWRDLAPRQHPDHDREQAPAQPDAGTTAPGAAIAEMRRLTGGHP